MATVSPLRSRDFRWLLAGRTVDAFGTFIAPIALGFAMLDVFGSLTILGLVVGAQTAGNVLLVLLGGVVADRFPRSLVLIASNVVAAIAQTGLAFLVATDFDVAGAYVALAFFTGAAAAFDFPAVAALVPDTVDDESLQQANATLGMAHNGARVLGASTGGVIVAVLSPAIGLAINAASYLAAGAAYTRISRPATTAHEDQAGAPTRSAIRDLREGWAEFTRRRWLWVVVSMAFFTNAAWSGGVNVVGIARADATVGRAAWGFVLAMGGVGQVVGSLVVARLEPRFPLRYGLTAGPVFALVPLALVFTPTTAAVLVAAFLGGIGMTQLVVTWETSVQRHVPRQALARVASYDLLGSLAAMPLGAALAGPLAERVGESPVLVAAGAIIVAAHLIALAVPDVRNLTASPTPAAPTMPTA